MAKECVLGLSCAALQQQVSLSVEDCPNRETCRAALGLGPEADFELTRVGFSGAERYRTTRRQLAQRMLMSRGCPQPLESFGLSEQIAELVEQLRHLENAIAAYQDCYIAPDGAEVSSYSVKRPGRVVSTPEGRERTVKEYWYNKLMSQQAIFAPAEQSRPVKVLHLSRDDDPRHQEARQGIDRRNQLHQLQTQLRIAEGAISRAWELVAQSSEVD